MTTKTSTATTTGIAFVGCGFVADYYISTLKHHPELELVGVMDRDSARATQFGTFYAVKVYPTLPELLADSKITIVANLTNPDSHFEVSKQCLAAGKHVYSEKPLAMSLVDAHTLVELAAQRGLSLSSAPCGILGETAQTLWQALQNHEIGTPRVVYAEIDDGPIHLLQPNTWFSPAGAMWPYKDEFEVGCTLEHAGYYLTWLAAFFGPAQTMTAFSSCLMPNKQVLPGEPLEISTPDFAVACITFASGVVARLTCSIVAPFNHALKIVGDQGIISVDECWNYYAPVYVDRYSKLKFRSDKYPFIRKFPFLKTLLRISPKEYPPIRKPNLKLRYARHYQDFSRGIAELAQALREQRPSYITPEFSLHIHEIVLALQNALATNAPYHLTTTFKPLLPRGAEELI